MYVLFIIDNIIAIIDFKNTLNFDEIESKMKAEQCTKVLQGDVRYCWLHICQKYLFMKKLYQLGTGW